MKVYLSEAGLLQSSCLNAETLKHVSRTRHITPLLPTSTPLAHEDHHPPPQNLSSLHQTFPSFPFHCPVLPTWMFSPLTRTVLIFSVSLSYGVNFNLPCNQKHPFLFLAQVLRQ